MRICLGGRVELASPTSAGQRRGGSGGPCASRGAEPAAWGMWRVMCRSQSAAGPSAFSHTPPPHPGCICLDPPPPCAALQASRPPRRSPTRSTDSLSPSRSSRWGWLGVRGEGAGAGGGHAGVLKPAGPTTTAGSALDRHGETDCRLTAGPPAGQPAQLQLPCLLPARPAYM